MTANNDLILKCEKLIKDLCNEVDSLQQTEKIEAAEQIIAQFADPTDPDIIRLSTVLISIIRSRQINRQINQFSEASLNRQTSILQNSTNDLEDSLRLTNESQDIAINVLSNLDEQRETLLRSQIRSQQTHSLANEAGTILKRIALCALFNKILLYTTILLLIAAIAVVTWYKFIK